MSEHELIVREPQIEPRSDLDGIQTKAWMVGGLAAILVAAGYFTSGGSADFYRAYLIGWLFSLGIAMGLFAVQLLSLVSGGEWGIMMRRVSEASGRTLPFFLLAGVPIVLGLEKLYPWARPDEVAHDPLLQYKSVYLNTNGFLFRGVLCLVLWTVLAYVVSAWSHKYDETGDAFYREKMKRLGAFGMVVYVLTGTFASVDWIMSLDPHWFSSLFGVAFVAGQGLSAFAFVIIAMAFLARRKPFSEFVRTKLFHDYGKLMLALTVFWAYLTFSQYLIIWSGDLPEEITWYLDRSGNGWKTISVALILGHFVLPFLFLLSADLKKQPAKLAIVACWVLVMRWFDFYWLVSPSVSHEAVTFHWLDPVVPVALVGIWLALAIGQMKNRAVLPTREPMLKEILAHG